MKVGACIYREEIKEACDGYLYLSYTTSVKMHRKIWRGTMLKMFLVDSEFLPSAAI